MTVGPPLVAVLWDVDGTLLRGGTVGGDVLRRAFTAVTGHEVPPGHVPMGGMTDHLVALAFRDLLPRADAAVLHERGPAYPAAMTAAVAAEWAGRTDELARVTVVMPGIRECLAALEAEGVPQVVVTGNVRAGAEAKLVAAGLHPGPLDLERGAYGDLPGPRSVLVEAARVAIEAHHGRPAVLVVVGDTPKDVEAAHAAGALAVGVATGSADAAALRASGAEHVLDDLSDPDRLLAVVRAAGEDAGRTTRGSVHP